MSVAPPGFGPSPHPAAPGERPELPDGAIVDPAWRPWTAWGALLLGFAGAFAAAFGLGIIAAIGGASLEDPPGWVTLSATVLQDVSLIAAAVFFARIGGRARPIDFGLRRPAAFGAAFGYAAACLVAFFLFTHAWVAITGAHDSSSDLLNELGLDRGAAAIVGAALLVCVVAPIAEEFVFRGYMFTALRGWRGMWPAAIVTGLAFGAIHIGSAQLIFLVPLAFFGMALCVLYDRTGSLYPGIATHAINNAIAFGIAEGWDWQIIPIAVGALAVIALAARGVASLERPRTA